MIDFTKLCEPFPPEKVHWRVGSTNQDKSRGLALAYIDARDVMERLDAACGPGNWQCRYPHAGAKTCCEIGVLVETTWVWKSDGAGDTDFEGDKGAFSDAFKRAAVRWGIGRYLYALPAEWVQIESAGRSYKIKQAELNRLNNLVKKEAPKPSQSWHGPLNITKLKEKMRELAGDIPRVGDEGELVALQTSYKDVLEQCMRDLPDWYYGGTDAPGAKQKIEERRKELAQANSIYEGAAG